VPQSGVAPDFGEYLSQWARQPGDGEDKFAAISELAKGAGSRVSAMGTRKVFPGMESILFRAAQDKTGYHRSGTSQRIPWRN